MRSTFLHMVELPLIETTSEKLNRPASGYRNTSNLQLYVKLWEKFDSKYNYKLAVVGYRPEVTLKCRLRY